MEIPLYMKCILTRFYFDHEPLLTVFSQEEDQGDQALQIIFLIDLRNK